ncbi:MAG TPA: ABC transporter ATP-binding protein [Jatrophihabitantaceae bacterium]|jgi:ABC-2 type transport system ATP-binding protein|nr:ABC transporter ATP-binding protein [Jatrophihabitantaceae bacterium]
MTTQLAETAITPKAGIILTGLNKTFKAAGARVQAVRDVSITITPGETVALLGPNGAGKSTTIDMMLGLLPADSGTVSLFGRTPERAIAAGAVGAMLQVGGVAQYLTVRELLQMIASLYPQPMAVDEVIELTKIGDLADRRTNKLSGGQTQRLRFAICIVSNPELLVLDEPTVAMDVEARRDFWATMRHFAAGGKTVLFATHYLEEADAYADRIILMAHGRVVADGPATEIKATVGLRTIRATLPDADLARIGALPGVTTVDTRGESVLITCANSDSALRAFLPAFPEAHDIEVTGAGLEEAFLQLTTDKESE